ncbi:MAG: glutathione S-transferase family protein [Cyanobacteriota bacterium]|nr:glutathione S-transferase family protein [Cyanobacteriota bacterium]
MLDNQKPFRLITISVSHYCEKVRWALDYLKLPYVEEPHMPPFHRLKTTKLGGKTVPVLVTENDNFIDSTDILKYLDTIVADEKKLYSTNPEQRQKIKELEKLFDEQLAPEVRQWGYFHAMDNSKLIQNKWCQGVPFWEKRLFPLVFPLMRSITKKKYRINADSAAQAYKQINSIFVKVNSLLADGRNYLVGDKMSAADITFASLAAPILQPSQHPSSTSNSQQLPVQMLAEIKEIRETAAGDFALNLYRNWR